MCEYIHQILHISWLAGTLYLLGVDELGAELVLPLEEPPVHLDVPGEGVAGADDGRHDPEHEGNIVACRLLVHPRDYVSVSVWIQCSVSV